MPDFVRAEKLPSGRGTREGGARLPASKAGRGAALQHSGSHTRTAAARRT